jgi:hypothetical protein
LKLSQNRSVPSVHQNRSKFRNATSREKISGYAGILPGHNNGQVDLAAPVLTTSEDLEGSLAISHHLSPPEGPPCINEKTNVTFTKK